MIAPPLIPVPPRNYGGIERIVYMLTQELLRRGHEVSVFANPESSPGTTLIGYNETPNYSWKDMLATNLLTARTARGFDVVHTFGRMSNIGLLMFSRVPKVVSYQLPPTVIQVKKAVILAQKNSLYFTACSNYIARSIMPYCDVTTIHNCVDVHQYNFEPMTALDAPLVFLGRIEEIKGADIAIRIARSCGKKLVIAGNVSQEQQHQRFFQEKIAPYIDNDHITYVGPVNDEEKNHLLGKALALLMPVRWDEPFGIVTIEALACGTPVIGFKRGALPEIIADGVNGYLAGDEAEMTALVNKVEGLNRQKCRTVAEEKFSAEVIGGKYEELYYRVRKKT
jgi:glycosyltransferase involved in cell wall biosynthesis